MNLKNLLYMFAFFICFSMFSQEIEWVETKATITKVEIRGTKRVKEFANIWYLNQKGDTLEGQVQLFRIPILGSMKSSGDVIDVHFDKSNPYMVETTGEGFINKYGMYIFIVLGVVFSVKQFLSIKKA